MPGGWVGLCVWVARGFVDAVVVAGSAGQPAGCWWGAPHKEHTHHPQPWC